MPLKSGPAWPAKYVDQALIKPRMTLDPFESLLRVFLPEAL